MRLLMGRGYIYIKPKLRAVVVLTVRNFNVGFVSRFATL